MKMVWVNVYTHPKVQGEYSGNEHETKEAADLAAAHETYHEPEAVLVRQEERPKGE